MMVAKATETHNRMLIYDKACFISMYADFLHKCKYFLMLRYGAYQLLTTVTAKWRYGHTDILAGEIAAHSLSVSNSDCFFYESCKFKGPVTSW
jgi:hypothetical protein